MQTFHDNIFNHQFSALQLSVWFEQNFPDASGVEIYKGTDPFNLSHDRRVWYFFTRIDETGYMPGKRITSYGKPECPVEFTLSRELYFYTYGGYKNDYVAFMLQDSNKNSYIVRWDYSRSTIRGNYIAALALLIFTANKQDIEMYPRPYEFCVVAYRNYYIELNKLELAARN